MTASRQGDAGTTLVELMVSLAVMAMLMVIATSLFSSASRVWERTADQKQLVEFALIRDRIRASIQAMPLPREGVDASFLFSGTEGSVTWIVPAADLNRASANLVQFSIRMDTAVGERSVSLSEQIYGSSTPFQIVGNLHDKVGWFRVSYYGTKLAGESETWYSDWREADFLPLLLKIEMETIDGGPVPPLTIQPALNARQSTISLSSPVPPG